MSFSYGYHYCNNQTTNCIKASLAPTLRTELNALNELKATVKSINSLIKIAEEKIVKPRTIKRVKKGI